MMSDFAYSLPSVTVFVSVIRVPFLRYFSRVYSFATALILTDKQVLIVREQGVEGSAGKYGRRWTFCPLLRLQNLAIDRPDCGPSVDVLRLQLGSRPSGAMVKNERQRCAPARRFIRTGCDQKPPDGDRLRQSLLPSSPNRLTCGATTPPIPAGGR